MPRRRRRQSLTAFLDKVEITYSCAGRVATAQPTIDTEEPGTCNCGDYCYCSPVEVSAVVQCAFCGQSHYFDVKYYRPRSEELIQQYRREEADNGGRS